MIQEATKEDGPEVMPLMHSAIGSIACSLAGVDGEEEAMDILAAFYEKEGNRISYRNVIVDKRDGKVAGILISYGGDDAEALDRPFIERIEQETGRTGYAITQETRPGEYYLDTIAVHESYQGLGIAKALMAAFELKAAKGGYDRATLIVEEYNDRAYALYVKMGYTEDGELEVSGHRYKRMVKQVSL
ncbi:GNAT family N-acetyltransferase [Paenibacillus radicis (ex Gao et al. 2016)]|uniref:Acetyltransferase n=1 Tax=Paenibacillus radicis (ex Gao et al. 2016) TaxID=1737354 RepID=A0A917M4Q3_9BACL|nr:GNAT family N-acetyltransferase [Paenibacillus radicis (ex Gao et al. 2016)]GGG76832.1 acetyltransferase [Paenibacillus radicis (ex Gao et al. 2016)]